MTERDLLGDLPSMLDGEGGGPAGDEYNFNEGVARTLHKERILSDGRVATMAGPTFFSPDVGAEGDYVALRLYRHGLMRGEIFLHIEDVIRASKKYQRGKATLDDPHFPGHLELKKVGQVIRLTKSLRHDGNVTRSTIDLTKDEMSAFARSVVSSIESVV
jgi:hypothetical protein